MEYLVVIATTISIIEFGFWYGTVWLSYPRLCELWEVRGEVTQVRHFDLRIEDTIQSEKVN